MLYQIALFLHITGALLLFIAVGLEWLGLTRLRRAERVEQVQEVGALLRVLGKLFPLSSLLILGGGLYMTITAWGFAHAWLDAALVFVALMSVLGPRVSGPRMAAIGKAAFTLPPGPVPASLRAQISDPVLVLVTRTTALLTWGIVFLMTVKPDLLVTLATLGSTLVLGLLSARGALRAERKPSLEPAEQHTQREMSQSARR
jgi:hypothetical protein